jgi:hypothetical protein
MPGNAACLLFWDYDTQWGADRSRSPGGPKDWGALEFENTGRLLDLHARYEIPACFAVVGAAALPGERPYHDPSQVRRIHAAGHEIASHGLHHEWLPGLTRRELVDTLKSSKEILEQCLGAPVNAFVPPFNQPFIYPRKLAPAFSEYRQAGRLHNTLPVVCSQLFALGYRLARVAYDPLPEYVFKRLFKRPIPRLGRIETIANLTCVRLNAPVGFAGATRSLLERCAAAGRGLLIVWAHPHSLHMGGSQDERHLLPFLQRLQELQCQQKIRVLLPSELIRQEPS